MYTIDQIITELPELEIHPAAKKLPMMEAEKLEVLKADILLNGMHNPIWTINNQILDGRARYAALRMMAQSNQLHFEPEMIKVWTNAISDFDRVVQSLNIHRNHYTKHQLAAYAVIHLLPTLKKEATDRMHKKIALENIPEAQKGNANYLAARQVGTNEKYVQHACQINDYNPAYLEYVLQSKMKLQEGLKLIAMNLEQQKFYVEFLSEGKSFKRADEEFHKLHSDACGLKVNEDASLTDGKNGKGSFDNGKFKPKNSKKTSQHSSRVVRLEHLSFSRDELSSSQPNVGIIFPRPVNEELLNKIVEILDHNQYADTPYTIWVTNKTKEVQETMETLYDPSNVITYEVKPFSAPKPIDELIMEGTYE
ncbi:hypothetical protein MNQ98_12590 [Paenibacillus sp. N3/727]|uniref:hypothetical protein n=1 Tax=Paenibacillus sp. N3/727 TaxID=2925845 RepID=UPI001F53A3E9|nr:hypothetical protein [Paenibacillus sp. N3/727]UNK20789.1 hypothetical protein MNQ98_12590 [Paenibacillus sp. N3/727]